MNAETLKRANALEIKIKDLSSALKQLDCELVSWDDIDVAIMSLPMPHASDAKTKCVRLAVDHIKPIISEHLERAKTTFGKL